MATVDHLKGQAGHLTNERPAGQAGEAGLVGKEKDGHMCLEDCGARATQTYICLYTQNRSTHTCKHMHNAATYVRSTELHM